MPPVLSAPITLPTFSASNNAAEMFSHLCASKIPLSTNWPLIRFRRPNTTLSSCIAERSPVNSLHQKLTRLALTTMSHNLDHVLTEASTKNLSLAAALESLADLELDARR